MKRFLNWLYIFRRNADLEKRIVEIQRENIRLAEEHRTTHEWNDVLFKQIVEAKRDSEYYRAQLMQLRPAQQSANGQLGWMVSAFIPEECLEKLRTMPKEKLHEFTRTVSDVLVFNVITGILNILSSGKFLAMVFEPPRYNRKTGEKRLNVSVWHESSQKPLLKYTQDVKDYEEKKEALEKETEKALRGPDQLLHGTMLGSGDDAQHRERA